MAIDRKRNVIEAANQSFAMFGYKATTMDQVAKIARVAKGTIYTFFKNKEALFYEIVDTAVQEMKGIADETIDSEKSFADNLHHVLYRLLEFRRKHKLVIQLSQEVKEMGTPEAVVALDKFEKTVLSFVKKQVKKAIDKGEIKQCDPSLTAFAIVKLYIAFVFDWEKKNPPLAEEEIAELFKLYLLEGLA